MGAGHHQDDAYIPDTVTSSPLTNASDTFDRQHTHKTRKLAHTRYMRNCSIHMFSSRRRSFTMISPSPLSIMPAGEWRDTSTQKKRGRMETQGEARRHAGTLMTTRTCTQIHSHTLTHTHSRALEVFRTSVARASPASLVRRTSASRKCVRLCFLSLVRCVTSGAHKLPP